MRKIYSLSLLLLALPTLLAAQTPREGVWKGNIQYSNAAIPFNFEVKYPNGTESPEVTFRNGSDRATLTATRRNDSLFIPMFGFDITLKMAAGEEHMTGELEKHYSGRSYPFDAIFGVPRYIRNQELEEAYVAPRWAMTINEGRDNAYPAVGLFEQMGKRVSGTIMTLTSDYRFFEGIAEGNTIELSNFDGVHSFLLRGTYNDSTGQWSGELVLDDGYSRPWTAVADPDAELPDPFEMIDLTGRNIRPDLDKLAALADQHVEADDYAGKVLIVQLMGTWCSNSQDQTRYLTRWVSENPDKEIEILAVNYEANYSPEYGLQRIETYKQRLKVPYPMILGGPLSKRGAAEAFSFIDELEAFPTLVFIDKEGIARYVHSYFTGPATGPYYEDFDRRFNAIVDELVGE